MKAVVREFLLWVGLKGELVGYGLEQGHLLFHFKKAKERDLILSRSWVVVGQTLAVVLWRPGFFSTKEAIRLAMVWICMLRLLVEHWREAVIQKVLSLASDLEMVDDCTVE